MSVFVVPFYSGFFLGASLIIAIGAQNAFVLRQGLLQQHVFILCLICALADATLIAAGVAGLGAVVARFPSLITFFTIAGAIFLLFYGIVAVKRALYPSSMKASGDQNSSLKKAVLTCLAFTFLNPHVYLDTFILVGSLAARYEGLSRAVFAIGAMSASFVWFFSLGYGAKRLRPFFERPRSWQILDGFIAVVMFALALSLIWPFFAD